MDNAIHPWTTVASHFGCNTEKRELSRKAVNFYRPTKRRDACWFVDNFWICTSSMKLQEWASFPRSRVPTSCGFFGVTMRRLGRSKNVASLVRIFPKSKVQDSWEIVIACLYFQSHEFLLLCCINRSLLEKGYRKINHSIVLHSLIDPYHAAAMLDLKRGWTGISNELKINYAFERWRAYCLCPFTLDSNPKWRRRDKGL